MLNMTSAQCNNVDIIKIILHHGKVVVLISIRALCNQEMILIVANTNMHYHQRHKWCKNEAAATLLRAYIKYRETSIECCSGGGTVWVCLLFGGFWKPA